MRVMFANCKFGKNTSVNLEPASDFSRESMKDEGMFDNAEGYSDQVCISSIKERR